MQRHPAGGGEAILQQFLTVHDEGTMQRLYADAWKMRRLYRTSLNRESTPFS